MTIQDQSIIFERLELLEHLSTFIPAMEQETSQQFMLDISHAILTHLVADNYDAAHEQIIALRDHLGVRVDCTSGEHATRIAIMLGEANHWG